MKNWKTKTATALSFVAWSLAFALLVVGLGTFTKSEAWGIHPGTRISESRVVQIFREQLPTGYEAQAPGLARSLMVYAKRYRLDPAFVLSVIHVESTFRPAVVSPVGAVGLMQLMPATAFAIAKRNGIELRSKRELFDPAKNLEIGMCYLKQLLDRYAGMHPYFALAAYNMGPARLDRLRARKGFRPNATLKYYEDVTRGVDRWRFYGAKKLEAELKKNRHGYQLAENIQRSPAIGRP